MCHDDPGWVCYMGLLESLFVRHPLRIDIAGSVESIRGIDAAGLERAWRTFYSPSNMILFVIGDLDRDRLVDYVARTARTKADPAVPPAASIVRVYPEEPLAVARAEFRKEMEVALPKLLVGFKEIGAPVLGRAFLDRELESELALDMLFGRGSDGFQRLYEDELILDDFGASFHSTAGVSTAVIGGETPRPDELREAIVAEIERVRKAGIAREDFERQKRKFIGSFIRHFNSLEYIAGNYTWFRFHDVDLFDAVDALEAVRLENVEARVSQIAAAPRSASIVVPK